MKKTAEQIKAEDLIKFLAPELENKNPIEVLQYLLDHNFINSKTINTYAVIKKYNEIAPEYNKKGAAVLLLSNRYKISQSYILSLLNNHTGKFHKNRKYKFTKKVELKA